MKRYVMLSVLVFGVAATGEQPQPRSGVPPQTKETEKMGSRVYRDPATGLLGPRSAESGSVARVRARTVSPPTYRLPNGAVARRTALDELDFTVVKRNADGSFGMSCAQGSAAAKRIFRSTGQGDKQ
jgi:hypothetical protein